MVANLQPYYILITILAGGFGLVLTLALSWGSFSGLLRSFLNGVREADSLPDALAWNDFYTYKSDEYLTLKNSNLVAFAEIEACEAGLAGDDDLLRTRRDFHAILQTVPPGYALSLHFCRRRATPPLLHTDPGAPDIVKFLRGQLARFWYRRASRGYENRVYLALEGETGGLRDSALSALVRGKRALDWAAFEQGTAAFYNAWNAVVGNLAGFTRVRKLGREEMFQLFHYYLNPAQRPSPGLHYNPAYSVSEQIADAHFNNAGPDLAREDQGAGGRKTLFRVLTLNLLPPVSYPAIFDTLAHLGSTRQGEHLSEYWLTQHYEPQDPEKFLMSLNIKQNIGSAFSDVKALRNLAQKSVDLARDAKDVTNAIQREKEGVGLFSMFCVVYDHDPARLETTVNRIITDATAKNARFIVETKFARFSSFLTSLPGHSGLNVRQVLNYRQATILHANMADLAMIHRDDDGDPNGALVFETPEGGFFRWDPFSPRVTSWNGYFAGTTGAGKSYLMNAVVTNSQAFRPIVYILDVGNSYDPQVQLVPGSAKVNVDFTNPDIRLNPFAFASEPDQTERVNLARLLEHLITGGSRSLDQVDRVDIMEALKILFTSYNPSDPPTLETYYKTLDHINEALAKPLKLWIADGPYAAFFCHKTDTFKDADLVYFELTGFDAHPDVASAIVFMLFTKIFQRLQRPEDAGRKKLIVMDECWKFLMNDTMAASIQELYRTVRKHNGAIYTITQSPLDLINSPHRDAILANTSFLFLLEQKGIGDAAREAFGLNPREYHIMRSVRMKKGQYSEALFKCGTYRRQIRVLADPFSNAAYTTDPAEKEIRQRIVTQLAPSMGLQRALMEAITRMAAGTAAPPKEARPHVA